MQDHVSCVKADEIYGCGVGYPLETNSDLIITPTGNSGSGNQLSDLFTFLFPSPSPSHSHYITITIGGVSSKLDHTIPPSIVLMVYCV